MSVSLKIHSAATVVIKRLKKHELFPDALCSTCTSPLHLTLQQISGQSWFSSSGTDKVGQDCVHIHGHVIMNSQVEGLCPGRKKKQKNEPQTHNSAPLHDEAIQSSRVELLHQPHLEIRDKKMRSENAINPAGMTSSGHNV